MVTCQARGFVSCSTLFCTAFACKTAQNSLTDVGLAPWSTVVSLRRDNWRLGSPRIARGARGRLTPTPPPPNLNASRGRVGATGNPCEWERGLFLKSRTGVFFRGPLVPLCAGLRRRAEQKRCRTFTYSAVRCAGVRMLPPISPLSLDLRDSYLCFPMNSRKGLDKTPGSCAGRN